MGYFLSDFEIREIKDRLNIVDLIEHYVSLTKSGSQYRGLCPFHDDKNPSLNVNEEKGLFHCFSCGSGGDMFGFYMRYNNISFSEAALELAKRAGVSINSSGVSGTKKSPKEPLYRFNTFAAELYHSFLTHSPGAQSAREYLKGRGLSIEAAKEFQLGFAPDRWDFLFEELKHKNMPLKHAQELGLIVRKKSGDGYYDMFRNRVVFPIKDIEGRVVGFGGRTLGGDEPKYINSPESLVYHKGRVLYGLDNARDAIRRTKTAVVVEGYMDCLALHSAGMKNALATLGTSLTAEHAGLLKRLAKDAVLVFDGDSSGAKASMRALKVFLNEGLSPRMVVLPQGDDPDSFISRTSHKEFLSLVEGAGLLLDFFIDEVLSAQIEGKLSRAGAVGELSAVLGMITDGMERSHYVKRVAETLGIREIELFEVLDRGRKAHSISPAISSGRAPGKDELHSREYLVLKIILKYPELSDFIIDMDVMSRLRDGGIKSAIKAVAENNLGDLGEILMFFRDDASTQELISNAIFNSGEITDREIAQKMLVDCVQRIELQNMDDKLRVIRLEIDKALKDGDHELHDRLISQYSSLRKLKTDLVYGAEKNI